MPLFNHRMSRREVDIINQAEKEFRLSILRELALQRFHIAYPALTLYQRSVVSIMYDKLTNRLHFGS